MQEDFHYYATYCAAFLAGYSHDESQKIAYSAQFVDCCTTSLLRAVKGPLSAATTQLQPEMMDVTADVFGLQDITRIWASFHFLPQDLKLDLPGKSKIYKDKRRLVCGPNGDLIVDTVNAVKDRGLAATGVAMHIMADTWAHRYFAGTPSLVINNTNGSFYDVTYENGEEVCKPMRFNHNPISKDVMDKEVYTNTVYAGTENSIMNLGHGRAGHLPDISSVRYKYMPAWGDYEMIFKDNPADYWNAFTQMIYAMGYLRGEIHAFEKETYDTGKTAPYEEEIKAILTKRQLNASEDWKKFGEKLSGQTIKDFDITEYEKEYMDAGKDEKDETFLGQFILAALRQKSMVTNRIFKSGSLLAGYSVDFDKTGLAGMKDFFALANDMVKEIKNEQIPKI